jgi:Uma2 family endonuclease
MEGTVVKVFMPVAPPSLMEERKRTGADQWDEMWDGVLHMPPIPNYDHQDLETDLQTYLLLNWGRPRRAKVLHQINLASIGGWPSDYRIPDVVLLSRERFHINQGKYFEGAPDVVVEIRSPDDEAYDKLPFYARLKIPEVWIIYRDTKEPEIYVLKRGRYKEQSVTSDGWVRSPATGVEMKASKAGKLIIRLAGDDATKAELPVD